VIYSISSGVARGVVALAALFGFVACTQHAASSAPSPDEGLDDEPPMTCVHSDTGAHRLLVLEPARGAATGTFSGVVRGTDHEVVRNASVVTLQPIAGGATYRARGDSTGHFSMANVAPGSYELRVVSIGYLTSRDTVAVTSAGMSVDVTQVIMRFLDEQALCGYLAAIDSEGVLRPAKAQTTSTTHAMPGGGAVQTTVSVHPNVDGARFDVQFRNVGSTPVDVTRLCYPAVSGGPVRRFGERVGPACYGTGLKLAPGDTLGVRRVVQLRGEPGTYTFRFHALDPPALDGVVPLVLMRVRSPRGAPAGE
jgi:hypothetical protein